MRAGLYCAIFSTLVACADDALPGDAAPPPAPFELVVGQMAAGLPAQMSARTAARGAAVHFVLSRRGPGSSCPPALQGGCVDLAGPLTYLGSARADARGIAAIHLRAPAALPDGVPFWVQAVTSDPARPLVKSAVVEAQTGGRICPLYYSPTCGTDGHTYGNDCELAAGGTFLDHAGPC